MINFCQDYDQKIKDVNLYLAHLKCNENKISSGIFKILKANLFLMLYNLVESVVDNSLEDIHDAITNERIEFKDCIDEIKALWVDFEHKKFEQTKSIGIIQKISSIDSEIVAIDYNSYKKRKTIFSGNLDAKKIREISEIYSINKNSGIQGARLREIKDIRNRLAHGEISFSDLGKNYSVLELEQYYKECKLYLEEYLLNVKKYINNKEFRTSIL
ncbi:MAE_28990/MAE_18760 family HEPN-like nuclease [Capnocytophaga stomatis]|uniref:MAE_28990/MAE_18760 family HEPN-like nuclease n=1 Tax=Capnocytophaga stomatis TaxID=1848904 RepID=A0ABW8QBJ3_9FLAO|nr:MAE_28990/MAE_18760 family HEPN-like nuclease [Capnocytophaga stomatis]GIJ93588.1 hypothetical protein CAPN002_08060 [Capnocytophaga stomatis]